MSAPLYEVAGRNRYCGPAAVAAVTGASTDDVSRYLRECWPHLRRVMATSPGQLAAAFRHFGGYSMLEEPRILPRPTLAAWARKRRGALRRATCLVNVTGHWCIVAGNRYVDSLTRGPVWLTDAPGRRRRVRRVWRLWKEARECAKP